MTETISCGLLYNAILYGATRLSEKREALNLINVFPVKDNDTGNNLAHTMQYILNNTKSQENVRDTLKNVARCAMIGSRGNSGAIFSQYLNGLYQSSSEKAYVTVSEMADFFNTAYSKAYKAIESPIEGTVITLMRAWSVSFKESLNEHKSIKEIFETSLHTIKITLEETKQTLDVLRKNGVVDAGALGFYIFMDGFSQVITGKNADEYDFSNHKQTVTIVETLPHIFVDDEVLVNRYCTEVLFEFDNLNEDELRNNLKDLGDCILISSQDDLARIHIHTNTPWEIIKHAAAIGRILDQKAEDMVMQKTLTGANSKDIALITDSIADIPQEFIFNHNVFQIPINIMIDGVSYLDKITVDIPFLMQNILKASSSQLNLEQIKDFLTPILKRYDQVMILTVSSKMSGTYDRFKQAIDELSCDKSKVILIDTKTNSAAQGLLVKSAVEMIESQIPLDEIAQEIELLKSRVKILVSVLDINPMVRSGRIGERVGNILIRLGFRPLVTINTEGMGTIKGVAFSVAKNKKILLKSLKNKKIEDYVIVHAAANERADEIKSNMIKMTGKSPLYMMNISSVVALFAGIGSVAIAYIEKNIPKSGLN